MKAYITLLSTDSYLDGVLALNESLKRVGAKYPLICAVTPKVSPSIREVLFFLKIETIEIKNYYYTDQTLRRQTKWGAPHWNFTADKLRIFGLEQYEKLVYIDADMFVLHNIDHLFDRPHLSACQDSPMLNWEEVGNHVELNAGLVVFEPSKQFEEDLIALSQQSNYNDQEALRAYLPDWKKQTHLILPQEYNIFSMFWPGYEKAGIRPENVMVLHFIGAEKPFQKISFEPFKDRMTKFWYDSYMKVIFEVHKQLENLDFFTTS